MKEEVDVRNCPYGLSGPKGTWKKKKAVESELRSCVKVEVAVLDSLYLISLVVSVDVKQHWNEDGNGARELCESREWRPGLPVLRSCVTVEGGVLGSPFLIVLSLCGRKATLKELQVHFYLDCRLTFLF